MSRITSARSPVIFAKISTMRPVRSLLSYKKLLRKNALQNNKFKLTSNGDFAKTHDPVVHLSSDCAMTNRQGVHCEVASSEVKLSALLPFVMDQGLYFRLSALLLAFFLRGSSPKDPEHF